MKSVIIVAEGTTQVALTPETDWEKRVLEQVQKHQGALTILSGDVYYSSLILRLDVAGEPPRG